ncbi:hypothetical protein GCM10009528_09660 [Kineococcus aurantiacus]
MGRPEGLHGRGSEDYGVPVTFIAVVVLAVAAGIAVVFWRTSPRHRVAAVARADHGDRARRAREAARRQDV